MISQNNWSTIPPLKLSQVLRNHPGHPAIGQKEEETAFSNWIKECEAAWSFEVLQSDFLEHVASCLGRLSDIAEHQPWNVLNGKDLYLAIGCIVGEPLALSEVKKTYSDDVTFAVRKVRMDVGKQDDAISQTWARVLAKGSGGSAPKISLYNGSGPLKYWLRSVATRVALNQLRKAQREVPTDDQVLMNHISGVDTDPEMAHLKKHYSEQMKIAFSSAIAGLTDRERNLLRYHHVDGLNIDDIGNLYDVHRVTAYRWIDKARQNLAKAVEAELRQALKVDSADYESIVRLVRSQIALSLTRQLGV